jgi:hypothetical protein
LDYEPFAPRIPSPLLPERGAFPGVVAQPRTADKPRLGRSLALLAIEQIVPSILRFAKVLYLKTVPRVNPSLTGKFVSSFIVAT